MAIVIDIKLGKTDKTISAFERLHKQFMAIDKVLTRWADKLERAADSAEKLAKAINAIHPKSTDGSGSRGPNKKRSSKGSSQDGGSSSDGGDSTQKLSTVQRIVNAVISTKKNKEDVSFGNSNFVGRLISGIIGEKPVKGMPWATGAAEGAGEGAAAGAAAEEAGVIAMGAEAGPIGLIVAAAIEIVNLIKETIEQLVESIKKVIEAIIQAGEYLRDRAFEWVSGGGTPAEAEASRRIGLGTGMGPGAAEKFQRNIQSGAAAGYAASIGIDPNSGPYGNMDYNANLIKAARAIMATKNMDEARRLAANLETPELANLKLYSKGTQEDMLNRMGSGASENEMRAGAELTYWTGRLKDEFMLLASRVLLPGIKILTWFFDGITKVVNFISEKFSFLFPKDDDKNPVHENTKALDENTRAIREMRETMGGGRRAHNAIPGRLNGRNLADAAVRNGLATGMVV